MKVDAKEAHSKIIINKPIFSHLINGCHVCIPLLFAARNVNSHLYLEA